MFCCILVLCCRLFRLFFYHTLMNKVAHVRDDSPPPEGGDYCTTFVMFTCPSLAVDLCGWLIIQRME